MSMPVWPEPAGPYRVGLCEFDLFDHDRPAALAPSQIPFRSIKVMAWYPVRSTDGYSRRFYLDAQEASGAAASSMAMMPNGDARTAMLARVETQAHLDAPVADGLFPLLVYCHGFASFAQQNSLLMEHLASHGYIVLSLGHPHESSGYFLGDGTPVPLSPAMGAAIAAIDGLEEFTAARLGPDLVARRKATQTLLEKLRATEFGRLAQGQADDNIFVVDSITARALPQCANWLVGAADVSKLAYLGMSYGGHVAALSCMKDPRGRCGVNLDGDFATAEPFGREVGVPFLAFSRDLHAIARFSQAEVEPTSPSSMTSCDLAYEREDGMPPAAPVHRITLRGGMHWDFLDARILMPAGLPPGLMGDLPPERTALAIQESVLDFFDAYLKGASNAFPARVADEYRDLLVVQDRAAMHARFG